METKKKPTFISFDWDLMDTSSSKTENSKESYSFSFSDLDSEDDKYDGSEMYKRICEDKQLQNSYSSTTTRAKTKISDDSETVAPKKKRKAKKTQLKRIETAEPIKENLTQISEKPVEQPSAKTDAPKKKKKKFKNKYVKNWKSKYEKFYKNKKKFILDIIREEEGPFLFKLQLQYNESKKPRNSGKKQNSSSSDTLSTPDEDGNTYPPEKLKSKVLKFFKTSKFKPETDIKSGKKKKMILSVNYEKVKISKPKNNQIKAFVTVFSRDDAVQIYDYFFKLKSVRFSSAIYLIIENDILKKHTIHHMKLHEQKKKQQKQELMELQVRILV